MSPHCRSSYGNVLEIFKGRWCWVEDVQGWSWVQDIAMTVGFLPHSIFLLLKSPHGGVCCCVLTRLGQATLVYVVFITVAFFILELPHNNFFPPAFFIILSGKLIVVFHSWVHQTCVFSSCWALSILKLSTDILCFPSSELSPFLSIRQLLACCFFFLSSFYFFFLEDPCSEKQRTISAWSISKAHCWGIAWFMSLASLL